MHPEICLSTLVWDDVPGSGDGELGFVSDMVHFCDAEGEVISDV